MFHHLQVYDRRERTLVGAADTLLRVASAFRRKSRFRRKSSSSDGSARRILLLRLERIGDLLMSLEAIGDVVRAAPDAQIDLVVGSWNADLARAIPGITRIETLDPVWLAREHEGLGMLALLAHARQWRKRRYDLAINFEPDIRSNLLLAAAGAGRTAGFVTGGGGPLLDTGLHYDTRARTVENTRRLAAAVFGIAPPASAARLHLPAAARQRADVILEGARRPLIGVHASGGREIKQWDPARFGDVAARLVRARGATIVLTGSSADRAIVDAVRRVLPPEASIDLVGAVDLVALAAVLEKVDLLVTGDTGPMHLAAAVGTPVVAVFGPSDPARYAPAGEAHRVVRVSLPCSPCNRIRLPPQRCVGHTPDCLAGISADAVYLAVEDVLAAREGRPVRSERSTPVEGRALSALRESNGAR
jgi:ADP-heptose:LPS heptosyltransferase